MTDRHITATSGIAAPTPGADPQPRRGRLQDPAPWTGRHDGPGAPHARWHERVRPAGRDAAEHIGVVGFASDEGVRRNQGRVGAAEGPAALRRALAPLALHGRLAEGGIGLIDHGDAVTAGEDLERGQADAAAAISGALDAPGNLLTVVLGGGHETAWASYGGLVSSQRLAPRGAGDGEARLRWGVLNLDAHFDLRDEPRPTSGTPFLQMARAEEAEGRELNYAVVGIAEPSNTEILFERARELGVRWMTDVEALDGGAAAVREFVEEFVADLDVLYLTVDLDLMPASVAPGVSAPAGLGVPPHLVLTAVNAAAHSGKLALMDVVELNPSLDIDARTARTAARLIDHAVGVVAGR